MIGRQVRIAILGTGPTAKTFAAATQLLPGARVVESRTEADAVVVVPPLAGSLAAADGLIADPAVAAYGEALLYAHAPLMFLDRLGELGPLTHVDGHAARPVGSGSDPLVDPAPSALALLLVAASPAYPVAVQTEDRGRAMSLQLEFDTGLRARLEIDSAAERPLWDLQAASHAGTLRLELTPEPLVAHDGAAVTLRPAGSPLEQYGYLRLLEVLVDDVRSGREPQSDLGFGLAVLEVLYAVAASAAAGGEPAPIPWVGDRRLPLSSLRPASGGPS